MCPSALLASPRHQPGAEGQAGRACPRWFRPPGLQPGRARSRGRHLETARRATLITAARLYRGETLTLLGTLGNLDLGNGCVDMWVTWLGRSSRGSRTQRGYEAVPLTPSSGKGSSWDNRQRECSGPDADDLSGAGGPTFRPGPVRLTTRVLRENAHLLRASGEQPTDVRGRPARRRSRPTPEPAGMTPQLPACCLACGGSRLVSQADSGRSTARARPRARVCPVPPDPPAGLRGTPLPRRDSAPPQATARPTAEGRKGRQSVSSRCRRRSGPPRAGWRWRPE